MKLLGLVLVSWMLVACGGGSESGSTASDNQALLRDYACDMSQAQANSPVTPFFSRNPVGYYTSSMTWDPLNPPGYDQYHERWQVTIAGGQYFLNTLLVLPRVGRNGIIFVLHGLGAAQATMNIDVLRGAEETEFIKRGYAVVYIARRGSFGSSGAMVGNDEGYTVSDYTSQRVSAGEYGAAHIRYQSASMVAALDRIYTDSRFRDHLHRMALMGGSGGAFTALYTAALSPVFKSAGSRALIRTTGANSQNYLNDPLSLAAERYSDGAYASNTTAGSLWFAGALDPIANPGQLACVYAYYQKRSANPDQFYLVPGMDHGGFNDFWSPALYPIFSAYLRSRSFPNF
jgi:pimeloyl-ACP methyl ester carboxylesterase